MYALIHRSLRRYDPDQVRWVGIRLSALEKGHPNGCQGNIALTKRGGKISGS